MAPPKELKIYHICHLRRLASIASEGLLSDSEAQKRNFEGPVIGMSNIKKRRLTELMLDSHPGLHVGKCVPFYFCPRSIMLFMIHRRNEELTYKEGQEQIIHLQADFHATVSWANLHNRRWAFTLSNAGSNYFEDRADLACLGEINWDAVNARDWRDNDVKHSKQVEFLIEDFFPWSLIQCIGACTPAICSQASAILNNVEHQPLVEHRSDWYY